MIFGELASSCIRRHPYRHFSALAFALVLAAGFTEPASAADPVPIKFAGSYNSVADIPVIVSISKGFFRSRGIEVEVEPAEEPGAKFKALSEGTAILSNADSVAVLREMSGANQSFSILATTGRVGDQRGCWARPALGPTHDLAGKRVALGRAGAIELAWLLAQRGLTTKDIEMPVVSSLDLPDALDQKRIDVACAGLESFARVRKLIPSGSRLTARPAAEQGQGGTAPASDLLLVVPRKLVSDDPGLAARITEAVLEGVRYTRTHPELAAATVASFFKDGPRAILADLKLVEFRGDRPQDLEQARSQLKTTASLLQKASFFEANVDVDKWFDLRSPKATN